MPPHDPVLSHLKQLVGWTVRHAVCIDSDCGGYEEEPMYGLILQKRGAKHQYFCRIQCDPEGNGPGFLSIEKEMNDEL